MKVPLTTGFRFLRPRNKQTRKEVTSWAGVIDTGRQKEIALPLHNGFYFGCSLEQF